jgi:hypothetical protein
MAASIEDQAGLGDLSVVSELAKIMQYSLGPGPAGLLSRCSILRSAGSVNSLREGLALFSS